MQILRPVGAVATKNCTRSYGITKISKTSNKMQGLTTKSQKSLPKKKITKLRKKDCYFPLFYLLRFAENLGIFSKYLVRTGIWPWPRHSRKSRNSKQIPWEKIHFNHTLKQKQEWLLKPGEYLQDCTINYTTFMRG